MKNICLNFIKRFLQLKRKSKELFFTLINSLKKDFSFYNSHTELLAIWTVLFMTITGLFAVGLKRKIAIILFLYTSGSGWKSSCRVYVGRLFKFSGLHSLRQSGNLFRTLFNSEQIISKNPASLLRPMWRRSARKKLRRKFNRLARFLREQSLSGAKLHIYWRRHEIRRCISLQTARHYLICKQLIFSILLTKENVS